MLTLEKFEEASEIVKNVTLPTKLVYSENLSQQTGGKVYLKPENMQYTGAYKVRGAYYKISTMSEEAESKRTGGCISRKPCTGCCIRSTEIRMQGYNRYADSNTIDQSKSYKKLRRRGDSLRRCL